MWSVTLTISFLTQSTVYQSADFRLTGPSGQLMDERGHKSVHLTRFGWSALVSYAGVARTANVDVATWLGDLVVDIPPNAPFSELIDRLRGADSWLSTIRLSSRAHTFSVVAFDQGTPTLTLVTNIDNLVGQRLSAASARLSVQTARPRLPKVFIAGVPNPFPRQERRLLERMADLPPDRVSSSLAAMNRRASQALSGNYVSPSCLVSYLEANGRGVSMPFGTAGESQDFLPPDIAAMMQKQGLRLVPKAGPDGKPLPLKLVQMASQRRGDITATVMEITPSEIERLDGTVLTKPEE